MCFKLFLLCSISLLVNYDFILRYEAWVNALRTSSCIENFPQISAKPIAFQRNLLGKLPRNRPFFTNRFSAKLASKIPAKLAVFFCEFAPENPAKFDFFPTTYQKPCDKSKLEWKLHFLEWKSCSLRVKKLQYLNVHFSILSPFFYSHLT